MPNKARFEATMRRADAEMPEHTAVVEGGLPKPVWVIWGAQAPTFGEHYLYAVP